MMLDLIILIVTVLFLCFGFVVLFGAPYLPTLTKQMETALDLLDLEPGQTMLELGCGDGKVILAAARRGWQVIGYELNPILVIVAYVRTWRYRQQVRIIWGNFFRRTWPPADGIFSFVLPRFMPKVDVKIRRECRQPVKLASFAFRIPGKQPVQTRDNILLYQYGASGRGH